MGATKSFNCFYSRYREARTPHLTRGYELVFRDITVTIKDKVLLDSVNGVGEPGEMLAIMGPSGE